ncbi:glycerol-3-phosphate 1-O-acyltransferase PlsY [Paenibacillus sp. UNC451MF]|uniref:glycerol-3-phosphate 1-O-acyltransferase PlsY n=1 Tax=Paenibacillus sp. UNC451MF TaxID=1449063 RepID=UPI00048C3BA7|nr:glycerol-3-phosphate 1-O-acyltransferase PlsY [Paenibacillus sp. UNC451MF]
MLSVISIIIAYLLGSISFSYLAGKMLKGIDIRNHGSGNAGATNTLRVLGVGPAVTVLILDALKGVAAVLVGRWLGQGDVLIEVLCGLAAISGHNWPIYFGFRGGKGIATTIGVMITLAPMAVVYAGIVCILAIALTRYVSLGSLLFTALLPLFIWFMRGPIEIFWLSLFVFVFAWVRHRSNIVKLIKGQENKLGSKK